ncbi:hypothetical protein HK44_020485 [Pseudomonas fluorescens HK44]|uniref:Uncharacterized protein n=1 Tax=Pseudomonas fluorescens HK44 TaxID=1042209 RepID=A0A010TF39_PSEFL|nr:hypothetical protein [Pseudomonas fluorescens]EXF95777.1 hypothetical protein HK44_020485 [Pseudomonas fluorescens HK44]
MAYDNKAHCNTHQLKSRLNDDAYADLRAEALERETQPGALVRDLTLAALQFKREHGYFPLLDDQGVEGRELDDFPALRELARELNIQPRELILDLARKALAIKLEHEQLSLLDDKKHSA